MVLKERLDILTLLGMKYNGEEYFLKTDDYVLNIHNTEIMYDSYERFNKIITSFKELIAKYEKV